jgi:hypothetical protein
MCAVDMAAIRATGNTGMLDDRTVRGPVAATVAPPSKCGTPSCDVALVVDADDDGSDGCHGCGCAVYVNEATESPSTSS